MRAGMVAAGLRMASPSGRGFAPLSSVYKCAPTEGNYLQVPAVWQSASAVNSSQVRKTGVRMPGLTAELFGESLEAVFVAHSRKRAL